MAEQNEKTFSQAEVDRIVTDRLNRERAKLAAEARKKAFGDEWNKRGYDAQLLESLEADESGRVDAAKIFTVLDQLHPSTPNKPATPESKPKPRFTAPIGNPGSNPDSIAEAFGLKKG